MRARLQDIAGWRQEIHKYLKFSVGQRMPIRVVRPFSHEKQRPFEKISYTYSLKGTVYCLKLNQIFRKYHKAGYCICVENQLRFRVSNIQFVTLLIYLSADARVYIRVHSSFHTTHTSEFIS